MRFVLLCLIFAAASCGPSSELPDSEFHVVLGAPTTCFPSVADAITPLIERMKVRQTGESGVSEVRVTRREERVFVVDAQRWDSGDEGTNVFLERMILERESPESAEWCQTQVLARPTR